VAIARQTPGLRHAKMEDILNNVRVAAPVQIAAYVVLLAIMALLIMMKNRGPFLKEISWNAPERKRVWGAVFVGLALVAFGAVAETLLARWVPKTLPIENYFRDTTSAYLLAFFAVMVAPPVEELYFRGFLYPAVARWTGIWPAVVITSGLFALLHGSQLAFAWVPVMVIFVVGATLNIVRVRTGSVATGVVAHMTYNFVLMLGTFIGTHGFTKFDKM
jgi:membrane protease YdiL (CAAX protease family)